MTNDELIEDEIYVGYASANRYVFKAYNNGGFKCYIIDHKRFYNSDHATHQWFRLEEATEQEKKHLRECIQAGEYVECPKDEIIENFEIY